MGFLDSLKTGFSSFLGGPTGTFLGQTIGAGLGAFATGAGSALAQQFFAPKGTAAGSPFAAIQPTSNQFGPFGPQFGQQFGARAPFQTFPRAIQPGTGFPVPQQAPQFPIPFNPLLPSNALPNAQFQASLPFPTQGATQVAFPTSRNFGFQQAAFDLPFIDIVPQGAGALVGTPGGTGGSLTSPFRPTMAGAAAQMFISPNPVTGRPTWFRPAGRPILWSGDLRACKTVEKIARRARRSTRKR